MIRPLAAAAALLLSGCDAGEAPSESGERPFRGDRTAEVLPSEEVISSPDIAETDPAEMSAAEIGQVIGEGPRCGFFLTEAGRPVMAVALPENETTAGTGVIKFHAELVELSAGSRSAEAILNGPTMRAPGVLARISVFEDESERLDTGAIQREADLHFELRGGLRADYRGFWRCGPEDPPERD